MLFGLLLAACVDIPFRWTPGQIEIPVSVNGRPPVWFILDSGAEVSIAGTDLGVTGEVDLQVGAIRMPKQRVTVMPLANFKAQHRDIHGLIGYDFFAHRVVTIDYAKHLVSACDRPPPNATRVPLELSGRLPVVRVVLTLADGTRLPLRAMVDTGAQQAMMIRHPFAAAHGLLKMASAAPPSPSLLGPHEMLTIPTRSIGIGRWTLPQATVKVFATGTNAETDALIGNDVLRHFRVTFDYARREMLLEEGQRIANSEFRMKNAFSILNSLFAIRYSPVPPHAPLALLITERHASQLLLQALLFGAIGGLRQPLREVEECGLLPLFGVEAAHRSRRTLLRHFASALDSICRTRSRDRPRISPMSRRVSSSSWSTP